MRPIRLEVQGLTAYREPVEVDFTELDLFGITGPTGAGKSSLVDAITYALFGKAPRVGNQIKELISQGSDRVKVSLEFSANGDRYRVHRASARKGAAPVQLERLEGDEWLGVADRATEVNDEIAELLRMDYEAFIRSVLLPQGEFAEFLAGDRDQRRKVLDGLLQLGMYYVMGQKANTIAARNKDEADAIRTRLDTELIDATPEKLREAKNDLEALKLQATEATAARELIDTAVATAQKLSESRELEAKARASLAQAQKELETARSDAATGKDQEAAHRKAIEDLGVRLAANTYDEALYLRYRDAARLALELSNEERQSADAVTQRAGLQKYAHSAVTAAEKATAAYESAKQHAEHAQHIYSEARLANAAAVIQRDLKPGDPCPVCGGTVGKIEIGAVPKLDAARDAAEKAKTAEHDAQSAAATAASKREADAARLEVHDSALLEAESRLAARRQALGDALAGESLAAPDIAARLEALEKARDDRDELKSALERETQALNAVVQRTADATGNLKRWQAEVERCGKEATTTAEGVASLTLGLREAAAAAGWDDITRAVEAGGDTAALFRRRLNDAQLHERATAKAIGSCEERIKQIEANIKLAKDLAQREKEHRETAVLARDLASLLRADAFPTFIRERAMKTLAAGGSEWLKQISGGRYDLVVDGQDFVVEDLWNAGDRRSVKTLSGGETFLASLALALALAEQLPTLAGSGSGAALESLFIDEGFSHLDAETLDIVASALEVLGQDRRRLIGVITHVPALAERMPARIVVHKSQSGSTVSIE